MKPSDVIHESYLAPGTHFTTRNQPIRQVMADRRVFRHLTSMLWICNRTKIDCAGYLDQGHTLIMIWLN